MMFALNLAEPSGFVELGPTWVEPARRTRLR